MIGIIRISPFLPDAGLPPFFGKDKWKMVKTCHESFLKAGECSHRVYLLDKCPDEWENYFEKFGIVYRGNWGKKGSLYNAYEVAETLSGNILFLEDDYLWRPNTLATLEEGVSHFGMASPYDHPDGYSHACQEITVLNNKTWRWCPTNTHTFAVKAEIFQNNLDNFYYGTHDWQMFTKLQIDGFRLYTPLYSLATHLVEGKLAHNIDWESLVKKYETKM